MTCTDRRVLLLEDDPLIALDAEDMLVRLGAGAVHVAFTLADAAQVLEREAIDLAVLDIRIGDGRSDALALALLERGVSFIFTSGYGTVPDLPERLRQVPTVGKPYSEETLRAAFANFP